MKKGDYENAISRLKSSADLDGTIFETQYNLALAYTENDDYPEAVETFEKAAIVVIQNNIENKAKEAFEVMDSVF